MEEQPWVVETVHFGWIVAGGCGCTCDPATGALWTICGRHGIA